MPVNSQLCATEFRCLFRPKYRSTYTTSNPKPSDTSQLYILTDFPTQVSLKPRRKTPMNLYDNGQSQYPNQDTPYRTKFEEVARSQNSREAENRPSKRKKLNQGLSEGKKAMPPSQSPIGYANVESSWPLAFQSSNVWINLTCSQNFASSSSHSLWATSLSG